MTRDESASFTMLLVAKAAEQLGTKVRIYLEVMEGPPIRGTWEGFHSPNEEDTQGFGELLVGVDGGDEVDQVPWDTVILGQIELPDLTNARQSASKHPCPNCPASLIPRSDTDPTLICPKCSYGNGD